MNIKTFKYCIVVPVYETKDNLEKFVKLSETLLVDQNEIEMLFVDDGNDYDLKDVININLPNFKLIKNKKNLGYGASIKKGVAQTYSDIIGIIDCDNSYDLKHLINLILEFKKKECDLLVGKRIFEYDDFFLKVIFRKIINKLSTLIFNYKVEDINSGLRVFYKSEFMKDLSVYPDKFSITSTQTLCTISRNKEVEYIDTKYFKRDGKSKISVFVDPFKFIYLIFKIFLIFSPIKFFGYFGFVFIAMSLIILVLSFFLFNKIMDITFLILFISGINFIFFGLIAEIIRIKNKEKD
jgi:GT2 family glycosyltransferase